MCQPQRPASMLLAKCSPWKKAHVEFEAMSLLQVGLKQAFSTARDLMRFVQAPSVAQKGWIDWAPNSATKKRKPWGYRPIQIYLCNAMETLEMLQT